LRTLEVVGYLDRDWRKYKTNRWGKVEQPVRGEGPPFLRIRDGEPGTPYIARGENHLTSDLKEGTKSALDAGRGRKRRQGIESAVIFNFRDGRDHRKKTRRVRPNPA